MRVVELKPGDAVYLYIPTREDDSKKYSPVKKRLTVMGCYRYLVEFQDRFGIKECFNYTDVDKY